MYKKIISSIFWTFLLFLTFLLVAVVSKKHLLETELLHTATYGLGLLLPIWLFLCFVLSSAGLFLSLFGFAPGTNLNKNSEKSNIKYKKLFYIIIWGGGIYIVLSVLISVLNALLLVGIDYSSHEYSDEQNIEKGVSLIETGLPFFAFLLSFALSQFGILPGTKLPKHSNII